MSNTNDKSRVCLITVKGSAFTLIELLVVIAIIALLVSILLPSLQSARSLAKKTVCMTQMRSIGTGMQLYINDYGALMPVFWDSGNNGYLYYKGWTEYYGPYLLDGYDWTVNWGYKMFWCPDFDPAISGGNHGPIGPPDYEPWQAQTTSYWYGDGAAGNQTNPATPYTFDELMNYQGLGPYHILREQSWYHLSGGEAVMHLLYIDNHVEARDSWMPGE